MDQKLIDLIASIKERDAQIETLDSAQLEQLREDIKTAAKALDKGDDTSTEESAAIGEIAQVIGRVDERVTALVEEKRVAAEQRKASMDIINKTIGDGEDGDEGGGSGDGDEGGEGEGDGAEGDGLEIRDGALVSVGAGEKERLVRLAARNAAAKKKLAGSKSTIDRMPLIASAHAPGMEPKQAFESPEQLAQSFADTLSRLPKDGARGTGKVLIASADWRNRYPDELRLAMGEGNAASNTAKMALAHQRRKTLLATGGIPQPYNVAYDMKVWSGSERVLPGELDSLQVNRGGLTYRLPPQLTDNSGAIGQWTDATDEDPGESVKPVVHISVPDTISVPVYAITNRLGFGNLQDQFDPELIQANTDVTMAYASRFAEITLLSQLDTLCQTYGIYNNKIPGQLGASRDFVFGVKTAAKTYRYVNRIPQTSPLTIVLPEWFKVALDVDRMYELAHSAAGYDVFNLPEMYWEDVLGAADINVKIIWTLDGLPAAGVDGATYPSQQLVNPTTATTFAPLPAKVAFFLFADGMVQRLDGGQLNLGVVRDASLDATNDYETFFELFEALDFRGFETGIWGFVMPIDLFGGSGATIALS